MSRIIPILLVITMLVAGVVVKIVLKPSDDVAINGGSGDPAVPGDLSRRASGIPGDRDDPSETLRTLTELQQRTFEEAQKDRAENKKLRDSMDEKIAQGVAATLSEEVGNLREMFESESKNLASKHEKQLEVLQAKVDDAKRIAKAAQDKLANSRVATDAPSNQVALLETDTATDFGFDSLALNTQRSTSSTNSSGYTSIKPVSVGTSSMDGAEGMLQGVGDPFNQQNKVINSAVNHVNTNPSVKAGNRQVATNKKSGGVSNTGTKSTSGEPMYTIIDGSTLFSNTTMTAMLGKVPTGEKIRDPFRFKIVTGSENLAASKMRLAKPIENVIWTGYTTGNRELSCVSGYLDTVSLVYRDGTISTISTKTQASRTTNETSYLGYIADQWGKPCIRGQLYDNGDQYLRDRAGLAALSATAQGLADAQTSITKRDDGETVTEITGDVGRYIGGQSLAGATQEMVRYFQERSLGTFDVVYVPTGRKIAIHVEAQIEFNYDPEGRRLSHANTGVSNAYLD